MNLITRLGMFLVRVGGPPEAEAAYRILESRLNVEPDEKVVGDAVSAKTADELKAEVTILSMERDGLRDRLNETSVELNRHALRSAALDIVAQQVRTLTAQFEAHKRIGDPAEISAQLVAMARLLAEEQDAATAGSGERRRAEVYRKMLQRAPGASKRDIAMAIEIAVRSL